MSPEVKTIRPDLRQKLEHHWVLDPMAAADLSDGVSEVGVNQISFLLQNIEHDPVAIRKRDENRGEICRILAGESDRQLIIVGPCSLDNETDDYDKLLDYIEELQQEHPEALIAFRANGAKPRTSDGPTGIFNSVDPSDRDVLMDVYKDAFQRGIAILTEVTNVNEFGILAPYLSAFWLGARDMTSTHLRKVASATRLAVLVKNGMDGTTQTVKNALKAIGANTVQNKGSGVDLGFIASTFLSNGYPAQVTVGEGNKNVGIIARGYELPSDTGPVLRRRAVCSHIGELCTLADELGCTVVLDGSHGVPPMLEIPKQNRNRFPMVLDIIFKAAFKGKIDNFDRVSGLLGEIGTWEGTTDKNFDMLEEVNRRRITLHLRRFKRLRDKMLSTAEAPTI